LLANAKSRRCETLSKTNAHLLKTAKISRSAAQIDFFTLFLAESDGQNAS
jgi:hypothetical protein